jgi:hypothetical protein
MWLAIYPALTLTLWLLEHLGLRQLALPLRTLVLTAVLAPTMVYVLIPARSTGRRSDPLHCAADSAAHPQSARSISSIMGLNGSSFHPRGSGVPRRRPGRGQRLDHRAPPDVVLAFERTPRQPGTGIPADPA